MGHGGRRQGSGRKRKPDGRTARSEKAELNRQTRQDYYNSIVFKIEKFLDKLQSIYNTMDTDKTNEYWESRDLLYSYPLKERCDILFAYRLVYGRCFMDCQTTACHQGYIFPNVLCEGQRISEKQKKLLRYYDNKRKLEKCI